MLRGWEDDWLPQWFLYQIFKTKRDGFLREGRKSLPPATAILLHCILTCLPPPQQETAVQPEMLAATALPQTGRPGQLSVDISDRGDSKEKDLVSIFVA